MEEHNIVNNNGHYINTITSYIRYSSICCEASIYVLKDLKKI